jgi:hypothetical protein
MRCPTAPSLPWVAWASRPPLRRYSAPLRLPSGPCGGFACRSPSRYLAGFPVFVVSQEGSWSSGSPRPRQGLWSPGPPLRVGAQGDRGLSHVPAFPLWLHAPLSDPGGVLDTRHTASRTAACRRVHPVGFPLDDRLRDSLLSTTLPLAGLHHAACVLAPPGFVRPLTGRHAGALLTGWLDVRQVGLEPYGSHLLGHHNQFPGFSPIPKVSGFPWREHAPVRRGSWEVPSAPQPPCPADSSPAGAAVTGSCGSRLGSPRSWMFRVSVVLRSWMSFVLDVFCLAWSLSWRCLQASRSYSWFVRCSLRALGFPRALGA